MTPTSDAVEGFVQDSAMVDRVARADTADTGPGAVRPDTATRPENLPAESFTHNAYEYVRPGARPPSRRARLGRATTLTRTPAEADRGATPPAARRTSTPRNEDDAGFVQDSRNELLDTTDTETDRTGPTAADAAPAPTGTNSPTHSRPTTVDRSPRIVLPRPNDLSTVAAILPQTNRERGPNHRDAHPSTNRRPTPPRTESRAFSGSSW